MVLEPSVRNALHELLTSNFSSKEMNEIGKMIFKDFDAHEITGTKSHVTISPRQAADYLIDHCDANKKTEAHIKLVVELDDQALLGKRVEITGVEYFLHQLSLQGVVYDFAQRKVRDIKEDKLDLPNWGSLRDGKTYDISVMSIDIVGNSKLVKKYGTKKMETFYFQFWTFLRHILAHYDGRIWSWAGDGGICALTYKDHINRAATCAVDIQNNVPIFNIALKKHMPEDITIRIALDTGKVKFFSDTGRIVSDTVNYAAHLEKKGTEPGTVAVSDLVYDSLDSAVARVFKDAGEFENRHCYISYRRIDDLFLGDGLPEPVPKKNGRKMSAAK